MATKGSTCEFCECLTEELWNCEKCVINVCGTCNDKIHTKLSSKLEHTVSKMNGNDDAKDAQVLKFPCAKHIKSACFAICDHCSKCVCKECLRKPTQEDCNERLEKIKEYKEKIDENLPFFNEELESLSEMEENYEERYNDMKEQIFNRKEKLKGLVTEEAIKLEKELNRLWAPTKESLQHKKTMLNNGKSDLTERKKIAEEAIDSKNAGSIIRAADKVVKEMPQTTFPNILEPPRVLFSTKLSTSNVHLGSMVHLVKLKVMESVKCDHGDNDLLSFLDGKVMIAYNKNTKLLQQFVITLDGIYYIKTFEKPKQYKYDRSFTCIAAIDNNSLFCLDDKQDQFQFSFKDGNYSKQDQLSLDYDSTISTVYVDEKKRIFVGYKKGYGFGLWSKGTCIIAVYKGPLGYGSQLINKFEMDGTNLKAIVTNINEDIIIIDELNKKNGEGRLIAVNKVAQFRWEFTGPDDEQTKFCPKQVATSSQGYIFVSDKKNNAVYMLSKDGDLLARLGEFDGMKQPSGLAVNSRDQLLVGCLNKIHVVEIQDN